MKKFILFILILIVISCHINKAITKKEENKKTEVEIDISSIKSLAHDYFNGDYEYVIFIINYFHYYHENLDEIQTSLLHYIKGLCLIKTGKYTLGIKELEKSMTYIPIKLEKELYNNIGVAYFYLGDMGKAKEFFNKSLQIDFNKEAYNNLLIVENDPKLMNTTAVPVPDDTSIYYTQGWLYNYLKYFAPDFNRNMHKIFGNYQNVGRQVNGVSRRIVTWIAN